MNLARSCNSIHRLSSYQVSRRIFVRIC